ncbi:ABC transporter substrate-binding protein [Agromyces sp. ISL-38]|uniref:ABC transporter substrate-binding protein n=1 Tax=Agromyces sp. ISL-38 TaxID=2819107 RepID=UPI001BE84F9F|nr:ABC transporter substrate-binding protein [Agromyces sp. ISL-38]MBT2499418.1 ABC transporter substrate-binding protein [Agromyces sp. ISL-38]MBT2518051.1 ABC transporter substrate-binding protein [Streptomyces sp. ISL-90]
MKKLIGIAAAGAMLVALAGCANGAGEASGPKPLDELVVGFSQVGSESGWRTANTKDIQAAFEDAGIELKFSDAQQKQENQIKAIRSYIQQQVDVIAFSPVVETGWDAVLNEAKAAGIPVVLTDRAVDSKDDSLYESFLGSDFVVEGEKAGAWAVAEFADATEPVEIIQLEGTTGAAPAIDRAEGFAEAIAENPNLQVVASQTGDFTRAGGKQVTEALLKSNPGVDLIFAHNDDMGLGAIEAIEAAGLVPGVDVKILTIDAVKDGMQALADGKINYIVECSPLLGKQLVDIVKQINDGETPEKRIITEEGEFNQEQAIEALPDRQY